MANNGVELSVVIVSYNVAHLIRACLDSVRRESAELSAEVFVVDNASTDQTVALLREQYPWVSLIEARANLGYSAGNNLALPHCRGRYVVLLNPDTVVHEGSLRRLVAHLDEHGNVGAAGPKLLLGNGAVQYECARNLPTLRNLVPWLLLLDKMAWKFGYGGSGAASTLDPPKGTLVDCFNLLSWERDKTCAVQCISGACMVLRRQVVEQIGLLDEESPMYLDDIDYCRRMSDAGWAIHYVSDASVTHLWKQSAHPKREGDYYALGCHSIWLYLRKHHGGAVAAAFSGMACIAAALRLPATLISAALSGSQSSRRRLAMAWSLSLWAFRFPKTAPRFGFACEEVSVDDRTPMR